LIATAAEPSRPARMAALEQLLLMLPNKGQWSVLLALDETPRGWVGQAWSQPLRDRPAQKLTWAYDRQMGLRQVEESVEEDE
jgi:CRISPR-associated endonuclease/helicase Cas3